jgi:hypothetical protein
MICADFLAGANLATDGSEQNLEDSAPRDYSSTAPEQPAQIEELGSE